MANNENLIPIPGRLHSVATEGHVSGADEIYDDTQQKDQATINSELISAVGTGGSVDSKIATAKAEIIGDAATDYNTLGKLEDKIQAEVSRAEGAEEALDGRVDTLEEAVGTGGSVDSRISAAVATETTRAQAAEADRYTKSETYSKTELNNLITTPNQEYVSVIATAQTTAVTDVLPATGAADTTYRVGNWDGTQYNDSVFSEYAWNGSTYIKLSTKSQVGEVYDISVNHADTKYADLAAALGTNGANIPQSLRKGGMSVKFVQSSDNKYVQFRYMSSSTAVADFTNVANWQGVEDKPTVGSDNLVKSSGVSTYIGDIFESLYGYAPFRTISLSGQIIKSESFVITAFIPIQIGDIIHWYWGAERPNQAPLFLYDSNKNYLDHYGPGPVTALERTITIPNDGADYSYIRCSMPISTLNKCYIDVNGVIRWYAENLELGIKKIAQSEDMRAINFFPVFEQGTIAAEISYPGGNSTSILEIRTDIMPYGEIAYLQYDSSVYDVQGFYYRNDFSFISYAKLVDGVLPNVSDCVYVRFTMYPIAGGKFSPKDITVPTDINIIRVNNRNDNIKIEALSNLNNYNEGFVLGSDGVLQQNANYITTPYIPCTPQDTVKWYWKNLDYQPRLYLFDENKNYISLYYSGGVDAISRTVNLSSDSGVAYIRVSFNPSQLDAAYISINGEIVWYANNIYRGDIDTIKQDVQSLSETIGDIPQLTLLYGEKLIKQTYTGERISLFDDNSVNYERKQFSTIPFESTQNQSFAINGEYIIFLFHNTMNAVMYRLTDNTKVCDLSFPIDSTYGGSHNNACGFGTEKYSDDSVFPMFYISQFTGETKGYLAYDLVTNSDGTYTPKLVQIIVPSSELRNNDSFGLGPGDYCIDKDNNKLYRIGYKPNQIGGNVMVSKFNMPTKEDGIDFVSSTGDTIKVVTLNVSDMEDSFNIGNSLLQDNCYYKGNIIKTGSVLTFIDLATKTVRSIPINIGNGFGESEGVDVYMDRLIMNYWDKQGIFEFKF